MLHDFAMVGGILIKYGIILFIIFFSIALLSSFVTTFLREPSTVAKLIFVTATPYALAFSVPYFILHHWFGMPFWLNTIAGLAIYAFTHGYLEKRIDVRFKDERGE
ncbi:hypothetical protein [Hydrogenophaga defluvii]|uniref:Uncharacterized protein n=1 Tax=Hydrogenophaga defluvii TaxID=249410 RepID=A0ABW2SC73_9BURK